MEKYLELYPPRIMKTLDNFILLAIEITSNFDVGFRIIARKITDDIYAFNNS